MFTDPVIVSTPNLSKRSYVKTYIDGKRYRLYNGKPLNISCNPNGAVSLKDREKSLHRLKHEFLKKLERGWRPGMDLSNPRQEIRKSTTASQAFTNLESEIEKEHLSFVYERDLKLMCYHFNNFLTRKNLDGVPIDQIQTQHVQSFLNHFTSSGTNYMNRRRTLSSLFKRLGRSHVVPGNPVKDTDKQKQTAHLNVPYKKQQMQQILKYVKEQHPSLYLCCLIMYGCLLRPHQEIRMLRRHHFDESFSRITFGGEQNKSRRIRTVLVPTYVKEELLQQEVDKLPHEYNVFSGTIDQFNMSYFNTAWTRIKEDLLLKNIISNDHTLYSFRHTAAVNMYLKTKDPYKIQQAFGHSSLRVTLTYLRNLGLVVDTSLDDLPDL